MIPFFGMILSILLCLSLASPAFPQIYQWTDKNGNIVFSDTPPSGSDGEKVKVLKEREGPPPQEGMDRQEKGWRVPSPSEPTGNGKREYRDIRVLLYMKEWCPHSLRARAYLKSLGVKLIEYDVQKDRSRNQEKVRKSGKDSGVPVIDVEGIILKGFNPYNIRNAVEKRNFSIVFGHSAQREIEDLEIEDALQLARDIKTYLEGSPFPFGKKRIKKLTGFHPHLYRLRSGDYRVYDRIISREIVILAITHKKDSKKHLRNLR